MYETGTLRADGVVIYPVYRPDPGKLVVIRQFRYPVNGYIYEVPAGLVDAGEDPAEAAVREMKEETGLDFTLYREGSDALMRPFVQSQGMSDECDVTVFGYADGVLNPGAQEATEDIEVFLADKDEIRRILREELVSLRAAYLFMMFLNSSPGGSRSRFYIYNIETYRGFAVRKCLLKPGFYDILLISCRK